MKALINNLQNSAYAHLNGKEWPVEEVSNSGNRVTITITPKQGNGSISVDCYNSKYSKEFTLIAR